VIVIGQKVGVAIGDNHSVDVATLNTSIFNLRSLLIPIILLEALSYF
jgi:hypothetical protein